MCPNISIDDDVFDELKKNAEPLVDTPNTVLRRILGLASPVNTSDGTGVLGIDEIAMTSLPTVQAGSEVRRGRGSRPKVGRKPRAKAGSILADDQYEIPLLEIIAEHGGRAATREVLDELGTRLGERLTAVDREMLASGDIRWRNRAQFVRLRLVQRGDMVKDSPRGIWEITAQGQRRLAEAA